MDMRKMIFYAGIGCGVAVAGLGAATDGTWTGNAGTGSWAATNNWLNGSVPAEGGKAYFKASGPNLSVMWPT